jgi:hypothetical protein
VKAVEGAGWVKDIRTDETAKSCLDAKHTELEHAGKVAKAVHDNLESAARELRAKKKALVYLVETEIPKRFRVTDHGQVVPGDSFAADPRLGVTGPGYPRELQQPKSAPLDHSRSYPRANTSPGGRGEVTMRTNGHQR